ncbi:MAG: hypothetical protein HIU89_04785 [Proteobacteria bacterium]|nr:hypothetical protein [Pseudomonadota bacterium]
MAEPHAEHGAGALVPEASHPGRFQAWDGSMAVRLVRLGQWLLALPEASILGVVPDDGRRLRLPRGDALVFTGTGAAPIVRLPPVWNIETADAVKDTAPACTLLLRDDVHVLALRVDACLSTRTLHVWSIPAKVGSAYGIVAAAVLSDVTSGTNIALVLSPAYLASRCRQDPEVQR